MAWTNVKPVFLSVTGTAADVPIRVRAIWAYCSGADGGGEITITDTDPDNASSKLRILVPKAEGAHTLLLPDGGVQYRRKAVVSLPAHVALTIFVDGI